MNEGMNKWADQWLNDVWMDGNGNGDVVFQEKGQSVDLCMNYMQGDCKTASGKGWFWIFS